MDLKATRGRWQATYEVRRQQALDLVARIPLLGRLVTEFIRVEFLDRCMLITAQGLLALVPLLVVMAAFFPNLTGEAVSTFANVTGVAESGARVIEDDIAPDEIRTQTGFVGLAFTILSATSFSRVIQRMYERIWDLRHIGGISGARRCLFWLLGFLFALQLVGAVRSVFAGGDGLFGFLGSTTGWIVQGVCLSLVWWVSAWVLLFGRVSWRELMLCAVLTGSLGLVYNRAASVFMPPYVRSNAEQFGTLGVILAISTWLIGMAGIMVGSALVGRVVSEDPMVRRTVSSTVAHVRAVVQRDLRRS